VTPGFASQFPGTFVPLQGWMTRPGAFCRCLSWASQAFSLGIFLLGQASITL
jgi:hypothetical protein